MDVDFERLEKDALSFIEANLEKEEATPSQKEKLKEIASSSIHMATFMLQRYHLMVNNPDEYEQLAGQANSGEK